MELLNDESRCAGTDCPSQEICRRCPQPGEPSSGQTLMTALFVRREKGAAACDQYLESDAGVTS